MSTIREIYTDIAQWFDRVRSKDLMEKPYLDRALVLMPHEAPRVLDLGCGSGEPIASYLIARGCRITGIDCAVPMIELCQERFPDHDWQVGDMRKLDLATKFDVIIAWHSFFHLTRDEQRAMFPLFSRQLQTGGVLVFTSGGGDAETWGEMEGHRVYHASLAAEEYRALAAVNGFAVIDHSRDDAACGGATVWTLQKQ